MEHYMLAFDQGTTSSRALIFDRSGNIRAVAQKEFKQIFPQPGWVEHDPHEIWSSQAAVAAEAITSLGINGKQIAGIGITNQRETTVVWDRKTGEPIYNAIVWQDRRTANYCDTLKAKGLAETIKAKTGLVIDAYFSGTKINWILNNVGGAREKANKGQLAFGTIDSWLIWKLTQGRRHVTDVTNASRTMLYNINDLTWDNELLELMDIPHSMMPDVASSSEIYDHTNTTIFASKVPIAGIAGDQQAALFGQMCTEEGMVKNTYGTGCFMLMNTGQKPFISKNNLLTTIAWQINGQTTYALEGSIFMGGATVQWLRDGLGIIKTSPEIEELALKVNDSGDLFFVPSFTGMGAPHWDQYARGMMIGLNRGTTRAHIARAALDGIALQTMDVLEVMVKDANIPIKELRVDGGASANNLLMQIQADLLGIPVVRPQVIETTAMGAAYLAGLAVGYWNDLDEIKQQWQLDRSFEKEMDDATVAAKKSKWQDAVLRAKSWIKND
ncbi:MAG: glycerol kinase GlpK [Bacteroidales bacterium]|jgi:glycerol kinase|nr:glycerol kinase GlpK [Bacteroidales bacterium]MDN5349621.1 glycerol kinase [Bacteroidales bacterium]